MSPSKIDVKALFQKAKKNRLIYAISIAGILGLGALGSTLAANISLNGGNNVEFGQGVLSTTACTQGQSLTITPFSEFANSIGGGTHQFTSFTVSNIPSTCYGVDFLVSGYESDGNSPLPIFNTSSTTAVIYNHDGTFESGVPAGLTVTTLSPTSFLATFNVPVSASNSLSKLTIQSRVHIPIPCDQGGSCSLGQTGPGGGRIFYVDTQGFSCGDDLNLTCHYLEAAPNTWYGGSSDPAFIWADAGNATTLIGATAQRTEIGSGYANTLAIVNQGNGLTTSAGAVRNYSGGGLHDWYLGNVNEMSELGNAQSYVSALVQSYYATSEETNDSFRRIYGIADHTNWSGHSKNTDNLSNTRPIRAF